MTPTMSETTVSSTDVYTGRLVHLKRDQVLLPDGKPTIREWIDHPGAAAVVPLLPNGRVVMVRQYRYPARMTFLELPAGKFDSPEEQPREVAARELEEETGYRAGSLRHLGGLYNAVGYSNEVIHIFLATDLEKTQQQLEDGEFLSVEEHDFEEVVEMATQGRIGDMKTVSGLLMAHAILTAEG